MDVYIHYYPSTKTFTLQPANTRESVGPLPYDELAVAFREKFRWRCPSKDELIRMAYYRQDYDEYVGETIV